MSPNSRQPGKAAWAARGFTLIEILVAMVILVLILTLLLNMVSQTTSVWRSTMGHIQQFQRAREAFQILTTRLSRATLNTYWDYKRDASGTPTQYIRQSELRFINGPCATLVGNVLGGASTTAASCPGQAVFFQAPGGISLSATDTLPGALSTWGYFVAYGNDTSYRPPVLAGLPTRYRFRLFELMEPSDQLTIYNYTSGLDSSNNAKNPSYTGTQWFQTAVGLGSARMRILAENVVALIVLPKLSADEDSTAAALAPNYSYDSTSTSAIATTDPKNQLPPLVQVILVVVEENSHVAWGPTPPNLGMATLFKDPTQQTSDLNTLESNLRNLGLKPHHFSLTVSLPASKWSTNQTQ